MCGPEKVRERWIITALNGGLNPWAGSWPRIVSPFHSLCLASFLFTLGPRWTQESLHSGSAGEWLGWMLESNMPGFASRHEGGGVINYFEEQAVCVWKWSLGGSNINEKPFLLGRGRWVKNHTAIHSNMDLLNSSWTLDTIGRHFVHLILC